MRLSLLKMQGYEGCTFVFVRRYATAYEGLLKTLRMAIQQGGLYVCSVYDVEKGRTGEACAD